MAISVQEVLKSLLTTHSGFYNSRNSSIRYSWGFAWLKELSGPLQSFFSHQFWRKRSDKLLTTNHRLESVLGASKHEFNAFPISPLSFEFQSLN